MREIEINCDFYSILTLTQISLFIARHDAAATNQQLPRLPWQMSLLLAPSTNNFGFSTISCKQKHKYYQLNFVYNDYLVYHKYKSIMLLSSTYLHIFIKHSEEYIVQGSCAFQDYRASKCLMVSDFCLAKQYIQTINIWDMMVLL